MTKKQTPVNNQDAEIAAAEENATPVTPDTETVQAEEPAASEDPEDVVNGEDDMNEALGAQFGAELAGNEDPDEEPVDEERPVPAETAAPLMNHGTHNAAVNGLQTSPGYDPSKL